MTEYVRVTRELLSAGLTGGIGCKREQAEILNIPYPLVKGWQQEVIGTLLTVEEAERFLELNGRNRTRPELVKLTLTKEQAHAVVMVLRLAVLRQNKNHALAAALRTLEWATRSSV